VNKSLLALNELIRKEADEIIYSKGLLKILSQYEIPHFTGSYSLRLMTWKDLNVYLEADNLSNENGYDNQANKTEQKSLPDGRTSISFFLFSGK
jgi:hypothetical protein